MDPELKQVNKILLILGFLSFLGHAAVSVSNNQNEGVVTPGHSKHSKTSKPEAPALTCY